MRSATCFTVIAILVVLAACGGEDEQQSAQPDTTPKATIRQGGLLYDKFWKVSQAAEPTTTHPLWVKRPDAATNTRTGSTTWRCKECHGWDYKGVDGAYAKGSHRTGFAGVFGSRMSAADMRTSIAETHGYKDAGLSDLEIESLVLFVRSGLADTAAYIDEQGAFRGEAERGKRLYERGLGGGKACAECHGLDGLKAPKASNADYDDFVGKIANENPWEFLHKVRFGQPGTPMPSAVTAKAPVKDILDVCAYSQTLPKGR